MLNSTMLDLFDVNFSEELYELFIQDLLNINLLESLEITYQVKDRFLGIVDSIIYYGCYEDSHLDSFELYLVRLNSGNDLYKTKDLESLIDGFLKENYVNNAVVAFYVGDFSKWRFSLFDVSYECVDNGIVRVLNDLNVYSIFIDCDIDNTSMKDDFNRLLDLNEVTINDIKDIFYNNHLIDRFYVDYVSVVNRVGENIVTDNKDDNINIAHNLFIKMIFIYFIQERELLNTSKSFIRDLFDKKYVSYNNFYNDVIRKLFLKLSDKLEEDIDIFDNIPYINSIFINDNLQLEIKNDTFNHIIQFLDKYTFSLDENENLKENIITPETIFKASEILCNDYSGKQKEYYYPREVIIKTCQNTLIDYLSNHTKLSYDDLEFYVCDIYNYKDDIIHSRTKSIKNKAFNMPENIPLSIIYNIDILSKLIENISIMDVSVRSGSFILAYIDILSKLSYISRLLKGYNNPSFYDITKNVIKKSLRAVDLEDDIICKYNIELFLFKTLIQENEFNKLPLPNIDTIVMKADVLNLFKEYKLINENMNYIYDNKEYNDSLKRLPSLKDKYYDLKDINEIQLNKQKIHNLKYALIKKIVDKYNSNHIDKIRTHILKSTDHLLFWNIDFINEYKFDIVIGNPRLKKKELDRRLLKEYKIYYNHPQINAYYFEKGLKVLKDNGILTFLTTDNYYTIEDKSVRKYLLDYTILRINDYSDKKELESFKTNNNIIEILKKKPKKEHEVIINNQKEVLQKDLGRNAWNL